MTLDRCLATGSRALAAWMIALALLMKVVVPGGTMIGAEGGTITIMLCNGTGPMQMAMALRDGDTTDKQHQGKDQPCAFSGLAAPSLGAVDAAVLATAIAFIVEAALRQPSFATVTATAYLRPHLRGPPAVA